MSIARRSFLKSATMTTLSAGLAFGSAHFVFGQQARREENQQLRQVDAGDFQVPFKAQQDTLLYFKASTFTPYVGDIFQAPNARGELIELKLTRVSEYKMQATTKISTRKTQQPESFSLTFSATEPLPPFTSIHKISHPALGKFDLFLTSHEAEDGVYFYEAIFNHLR